MSVVRKAKAIGSWMIADPLSIGMPAAPTGDPAIQYLIIRQDVAGLWLKYGVKYLKIETSSLFEILLLDATIC